MNHVRNPCFYVVAIILILTTMNAAKVQAGSHYNAPIEEFVASGGPLLVAEVVDPPSTSTNHEVATSVFKMKTIQVFCGQMPESFNILPAFIHDGHFGANDILRKGDKCLLCLEPQQNDTETFNIQRADNSICPTEWLAKVEPFLLAAIPIIVRIEGLPDGIARAQAQTKLLDNPNEELQKYALRSLFRRYECDAKEFDNLQEMLSKFIAGTNRSLTVLQEAYTQAFFVSRRLDGNQIWPDKLISACFNVAETDKNVEIRSMAVNAVWGMCQTGSLGPKHSDEVVLPRLIALFSKETDSHVSSMIAMAITVIGNEKYGQILDALKNLPEEQKFYVSSIKNHWKRETTGGAMNINSSEFYYRGKEKTVQPTDAPGKK